MKPTSGPWEAITAPPDCGHAVTVYGPPGPDGFRNICSMALWQTQESREANARLIASSPELFDCVSSFVRRFGAAVECDEGINGGDAVDWISENMAGFKNAMKKAEGRG